LTRSNYAELFSSKIDNHRDVIVEALMDELAAFFDERRSA
jgi:hypothetical protein